MLVFSKSRDCVTVSQTASNSQKIYKQMSVFGRFITFIALVYQQELNIRL